MRAAEEESLRLFREKEKKWKKRTILKSYGDRISDASKNSKIKTVIDFSHNDTASIKALGVKKRERM